MDKLVGMDQMTNGTSTDMHSTEGVNSYVVKQKYQSFLYPHIKYTSPSFLEQVTVQLIVSVGMFAFDMF